MANSVRVLVTIWNRQYELTAHQHSKAAWIARGDFNGEPLERYGRHPPPELQQAGANRRGCARLADQCAL